MEDRRILDSWKEISAYLRRNMRTCQIWERELGLPIYRLDGSPKARVFAYKDELDGWLDEQLRKREVQPSKGLARLLARKRALFLALVAVIMIATVAASVWIFLVKKQIPLLPHQKPSVAVVSFENQTGDEAYDYLKAVIPNLLITNLEQSGYFEVTTWERLHDLLKQAGKAEIEFIDRELGFELCRMDGVDAVVIGSYTKAGDMFVTDLKVLDVSNKRLLKSASARGLGDRSILERQIDALSKEIVRGAGLLERPEDASNFQIADVTTSSLEAYVHYLQGKSEFLKFNDEGALRYLEKATDLDASFGAAYLYLAWIHYRLGDYKSGNACLQSAKNFSKISTEKTRLFIEYEFAWRIENNSAKGIRILERAVEKYPKDKELYWWLGQSYIASDPRKAVGALQAALRLDAEYAFAWNQLGWTYAVLGKHEEGIACIKKYLELSPGEPNPWDTLAFINFLRGNLSEAIANLEKALQIRPNWSGSFEFLPYIFACMENYVEAMKWCDGYVSVAPTMGLKLRAYFFKGFYLFWIGKLEESLISLQSAEDLARALEAKFALYNIVWFQSYVHLNKREYEESRQSVTAWFEENTRLFPGFPELHAGFYAYMNSLIDLMEGKNVAEENRFAKIESIHPEESFYTHTREHLVRLHTFLKAEIFLASGSAERAISVLRKIPTHSARYLMGWYRMIQYNEPFIRDSLARAHRQKGDLDKAIAEYERLTSWSPESEDRRLIHPLYHYNLARLYEQRGMRDKAIRRYERFLDLYKDADPGTPEVGDARTRLAALLS